MRASVDQVGLAPPVDFALAFWMVHEVRGPEGLLREIHGALGPDGRLLIAEPKIHVSGMAFDATTQLAERVGFQVEERPAVWGSRAILLRRY